MIPLALVTGASFAAAWAGIVLTRMTGEIATLWLANGIVIGALLLVPRRRWPALLAGFALAIFAANRLGGSSWLAAAAFILPNFLEALVAAGLGRPGAERPDFTRLSHVVRFSLAAGLAAPLAGATLGTLLFGPGPGAPGLALWRAWLLSDALGNLTVGALIVVGASAWAGWRRPAGEFGRPDPGGWQIAWPLALVGGATTAVFASGRAELLFLVHPLALLATYRLGPAGAALAVLAAALGIAATDVAGIGLLAAGAPAWQAHAPLVQLFLMTLLLAALPVSALIARQRRMAADQAERDRLQRVFDQLFTFIAVLDLDGTIVEVNAAPLNAAGLSADDVVGRKFWDAPWWTWSAKVREDVRACVARAAGGQACRREFVIRLAGDARATIDFQIAPLRDARGQITHLLPSAVDISDRKAAEEKLRREMHARDMLLYEVNHRVKNSLQLVTSILALEAGKIADPSGRAMLMDARRKIVHVAQLHQRLYGSGRHDSVDFSAFLRDLAGDIVAAAGGEERVRVRFEGAAGQSLDLRLAAPLALIASELVTNALKHGLAAAGGTLAIEFEVRGGSARLTVADDGAGLPLGFDPGASDSVGMRIVLGLVDQLRGRLACGRSGPGASFTVTVPLAEDRHDRTVAAAA